MHVAHLGQMQTLVNAICLEEKLARRDKTPHLTRADEWLSTNGCYILGGSLQQEQKVQTKKTHCRFLGSELLCLLSPPHFWFTACIAGWGGLTYFNALR